MGVRNRVGIGLPYRPARLHRLAELIPWNRFLDPLKVKKFGLWILTETRNQVYRFPLNVQSLFNKSTQEALVRGDAGDGENCLQIIERAQK
jgi:hypothetical protein